MLLELGNLIACPGGIVPFSQKFDFSALLFGSSCPAVEPVCVSGQVQNKAGVLHLTAVLDTHLHCVCDRCASAYERPFHLDVAAILVQELAEEEHEDENIFVLQGDAVDLDDVFTTVFVLNMDSKFLCRPDCRGLCPVCGKNLNEGPCTCKKEPDPRLAVLGRLLQDREEPQTVSSKEVSPDGCSEK